MDIAYLVIAILLALFLALSGLMKIRRNPQSVQIIHKTVGVPLKLFPLLASLEFAGAIGLPAGIWRPWIGIAAGTGLAIYFVSATVGHLRVGDFKGAGPAVFMLVIVAAALALRILTHTAGVRI
jgi:uncharacterized membrane protein YphA (DoxX/SURF4 family)